VSVIDVNLCIGSVPYRAVPHPEPAVLARVLAREGVDGGWVGHLPSAFADDPLPGNDALFAALTAHRGVLAHTPAIRPDRAGWERAREREVVRGAAAIRAYPRKWKMRADDESMRDLSFACGEAGIPLLLTVRLERAPMLNAAAIRNAVRASVRVKLVVTAAGRELIEATRESLTHEERMRIWWDISWVAGPPADDLAHLVRTVGAGRLLYGSGWPLRLTQTPRANLELLPNDLLGIALADASALLA
jgi:hypothetical protein